MPFSKLLLLPVFAMLLLLATSGRAQGRRGAESPPRNPQYREVRVSVTLPKAVNVIRDYGRILLTRNQDKGKVQRLADRFRDKTAKPVVEVTVEVPRNWVTRKLGLAE
ncbi:MAG: hypothetical protein H7Z21_15815 [Hymenobacter sp.]|nr:hypothetical protein [Hymenobacter sp.]